MAKNRKSESERSRCFMTRLGRNQAGNVLPLVGAALLPLLAMIGSGVDMSRAYMAKTRLQSACDAAALAGRRVLSNDTLTEAETDPVRVEVNKFINFNFPQGMYDTTAFTPVVTKPESGTIRVATATTIPTSIMQVFGFENLPLSVTCEASQNFVNTDIVLVLDVTGSMLCEMDGSDCDGDSDSKLEALREAVLALYDELEPIQEQLEAADMRLRYGVAAYSSGINVGKLLVEEDPSYLVGGYSGESWTYQTRYSFTPPGSSDSAREYYCYANYSNWSYSDSSNLCTFYSARSLDVSGYVAARRDDDPLTVDPSAYNVRTLIGGNSDIWARWEGCIEERQSTPTITSASDYAIPEEALDLNINHVPDGSVASKWKPYFPEVSYERDGGKPQVACPSPSKRLQAWERDDLEDYLDALAPTGGTYHDNGIIWGARMISAEGVFADSPDEFNSMPVNKHIIFMTDGLFDTGYETLYTTYGIERWDQRVGATSESNQLSRHRQRFKMVCNDTKTMNVSIWVIAFLPKTTTLESSLTECASSASQVSKSSNKTQLIAKFKEIGKNIGALRLTQ